jgi:hypothetical protein
VLGPLFVSMDSAVAAYPHPGSHPGEGRAAVHRHQRYLYPASAPGDRPLRCRSCTLSETVRKFWEISNRPLITIGLRTAH